MKRVSGRLLFVVYVAISLFLYVNTFAQPLKSYPAGELKLAIKKLNVLGSVLYVAAHPDDENTAMLAYLAKERLVRTAYLSVTRGDGGQNLIGTEQAELMGLIRTQELLQARRVDGAEQFFTRANDFGFSKSTEEALKIWDKDKVLGDVVWRIRSLRPDVIITRFPPTAAAGHGHHSASAVLAEEAFTAAADPKRYPEQLKYVQTWQARRMVWNSFNPGFTNTPPAGSNYISVPLGTYNPLLGKSYTEIAGESRSMHKSQGFGSARSRGQRDDYLQHTAGDKATTDLMDGIDVSWSRIKNGAAVGTLLQKAYQEFSSENPSASIPVLLQAWQAIEKLPSQEYYVQLKKKELGEVIAACAGLWYEANAVTYASTPGAPLKITASVVKRSDFPVQWEAVRQLPLANDSLIGKPLGNNVLQSVAYSIVLPKNLPYTQPYWLAETHSKGMYTVSDPLLIGKPENIPQLMTSFRFRIGEAVFDMAVPVTYKWTDPVEGEQYRTLEVRPAVMVNLDEKVLMFASQESKTIGVLLKNGSVASKGEAKLEVPEGWRITPASIPFTFAQPDEEKKVFFQVTPPARSSDATLRAVVQLSDGRKLSHGLLTIHYNHIPYQTLFPEPTARVVRLDIKTNGKNIAYVMGPGDDVPAALRQMGYQVTLLTENDLKADVSDWQKYEALVLGVRVFNTEERMRFYQPKLMQYVENGGVVVAQYNTNRGLVIDQIGPYPFEISRDRVTVEETPVKLLKDQHPLLNTPNKITAKDFEGWVQERGLYFAQKWDSHYESLLSSADPGEAAQDGGLIVANYGKGRFIYTGYAFFRQLPAGVPGAYRLFANLLTPPGVKQ